MKENIIQIKSYNFALKIVKLCKEIRYCDDVLEKQLLRSGTSIGANIEEAIGAQSRNDFIHKISVAYKEARETHYWIRLLSDSEIINQSDRSTLLNDCEEILKIIGSIQRSLKESYVSENSFDYSKFVME